MAECGLNSESIGNGCGESGMMPKSESVQSDKSTENFFNDSGPPLLINLGIDFGTMFTKVCFRDVGMQESQIITFGGNTTEEAMVPSVVRIEADGKLSLAGKSTQSEGILVRFLKMGLTDSQAVEVTPSKWRDVNFCDEKSDSSFMHLVPWGSCNESPEMDSKKPR